MSYGLRRCLRSSSFMKLWKPRSRMKTSLLYGMFASIAMMMFYMTMTQLTYAPNPRRTLSRVHSKQKYAVHVMYGSDEGNGHLQWNKSVGDYGNLTRTVWVNPDLDLLHKEMPSYLPNFKNPCWYERLSDYDVYKDNRYLLVSRSARTKSLELMHEWSQRLSTNRNAQRLRCLPYFMVIGQPKCGSTDLFWRIMRHKDVYAPPIKELHWWSRNRQGKNINFTDIIPIQQYIDMFDKAALHIESSPVTESDDPDIKYYNRISGEASVSTFWENDDWYHYPENAYEEEPLYTNADYVKRILPDSRLILILRDPIDRLFSDYLYFSVDNKTQEQFHQRIERGINVYRNCTENHSPRYCVYNRTVALQSSTRLRVGLYVVYLRDWLKLFARDQILILRLEDYSKNRASTLKEVFNFLKLRQLSDSEFENIIQFPVANKRKKKDERVGKMLEKTKKMLKEFYHPYNRELAAVLGDDRFLWQDVTRDNDKFNDRMTHSNHRKKSHNDDYEYKETVNDYGEERGSAKLKDDAEYGKEDRVNYRSAVKGIKQKSDYYYTGYR